MKKKITALSVLLLIDQLSKFIFYESAVLNYGGIFGVARGLWWELVLVPALVYLIYIWLRERSFLQSCALTLLVAGGMGNIIDRFARGGVVDFIHYPFIELSGNLADIYLAIAVMCMVFVTLRPAYDHSKQ